MLIPILQLRIGNQIQARTLQGFPSRNFERLRKGPAIRAGEILGICQVLQTRGGVARAAAAQGQARAFQDHRGLQDAVHGRGGRQAISQLVDMFEPVHEVGAWRPEVEDGLGGRQRGPGSVRGSAFHFEHRESGWWIILNPGPQYLGQLVSARES